MDTLEKLRYPIGNFNRKEEQPSVEKKNEMIQFLRNFPSLLKTEVESLNEEQLKTPYRPEGWTIAQLIHHLADSHSHAYLRSKHAFLESTPQIKGYEESEWAELKDATDTNIIPSLSILEGLHHRWASFFNSLSPNEFEQEYLHSEGFKKYPLHVVLSLYTWHSKHHLEHIRVLKKIKNW